MELTVKVIEQPVPGIGALPKAKDTSKIQVRPWTSSDAVWHYDDGTSVVYPAYENIDWSRQ